MKSVEKNNLWVILSGAAVFVACVTMLVFYFCFQPKNNNKISIVFPDMVISVGQQKQIQCTCAYSDVQFSSIDTDIAVVQNNSVVYGLSSGTTFLKATVNANGKTYSELAQITVASQSDHKGDGENVNPGGDPTNPSESETNPGESGEQPGEEQKPNIKPGVQEPIYFLWLDDLDGATFENNTLTVEGDSAIFSIHLFAGDGQEVFEVGDYVLSAPEQITFSRQLSYILLAAQDDGYLEIYFAKLDLSFRLQIKVANQGKSV